eukprot:m.97335 g.97335  ORF g.97335 m.97335 type:complete len:57 (-) comp13589_c0_seq4:1926-2096(-)
MHDPVQYIFTIEPVTTIILTKKGVSVGTSLRIAMQGVSVRSGKNPSFLRAVVLFKR